MDALGRVLIAGEVRTRDLGGTASTTELTDAIRRAIEAPQTVADKPSA